MTGHRRIRAAAVAAGALVLAVVLSACNPLVDQETEGYAGFPPYIPPGSSSGSIDFTGTESGWLEVRVTESVHPAVAVSGRAMNADLTRCPEFPAVWAWSEGASTGFQRLGRVEPGVQVWIATVGSSDPIGFDLRVVDDAGQPVGDLAPHVTPPGQFEAVGCPIG